MKIGKNGIDQKCSSWCQHSHIFVFSSSFMHFEFLQFYLKIHYTRPSRRLGNIFPLFLIFFVCVLSSTWHNLLTYFLWRIERPNWIEIGYLYIDLLNTSPPAPAICNIIMILTNNSGPTPHVLQHYLGNLSQRKQLLRVVMKVE